jgi:glycerol-3-phosphate dehydrogenase
LRPLLAASQDDPKSVTRDYVLDFDRSGPPLLSVYGGKLTTYRKLSETVVDMLAPALGNARGGAWTARVPLPGGDMPDGDFDRFLEQMRAKYPWLERGLLHRYARAYGTRMQRLLEDCATTADLGTTVLPGLYEREIAYLRAHEFARTAEDILYRRSKLGVHLGAASVQTLQDWLASY